MKNNYFYIKLQDCPFRKGDILKINSPNWGKVVRVYKQRWWKKIFAYFHLPVRVNQVKVKYLHNTLNNHS